MFSPIYTSTVIRRAIHEKKKKEYTLTTHQKMIK